MVSGCSSNAVMSWGKSMNLCRRIFMLILPLLLAVQPCHAAGVKAYVHKFSVSVAENRDELKQSLQTLLMSRLNSDEIKAVDKQADADIQVEGSYIVFGSVFSLDALLKTSAGAFIDRVFIQGDSQDELIPAVTRMAHALQRALGKWDPSLSVKVADEKSVLVAEKTPAAKARKALPPEQKAASRPATAAEAAPVMPRNQLKNNEKPWESHRLPEMFNGIAIGRAIADKGLEVFTTSERYLRYYLKAKTLQFLTAVTVAADEKIIGVDVADLDQNGVPEVYVSIVRNGLPVSQVYEPVGNQLKKIAGDLPYLLRGIAVSGKEQKIYGQKMAVNGALTGEVFELVRNGDNFTAGTTVKLPLFANLYNFNRFSGAKGEQYSVVGHPDGYLLVYSAAGKQLWKSRDKFGGSEIVSCGAGTGAEATACTLTRSQRLLVTKGGGIIAARNTGLNGSGARGSSTRNNVLLLSWDGRALQEKWRSGPSHNYLADIAFNDDSGELLLLEVEPKENENGEIGSRIVVRTVE